jgi:putative MATE family efflux protein
MFLEMVLFSVIGSMDTLMLSSYANDAVGAVGSVNSVLSLFQVVSNIITAGTGILCAQYIGAGKTTSEKQPLILGSLIVNTLLGVIFSLTALFGGDLLLTMVNIDAQLRPYAKEYLSIVGGFLFLQMLAMTFFVVIRSHGKTRSTMIFSVIMNVINVVLNYVLINGKLGFPQLGVSGAAIATVISKIFSCLAGGIYLFCFVLPGFSWKPRWKKMLRSIKTVLNYGSPAAGEQISYTLSNLVVIAMINSLGPTVTNTYNYLNMIVSYVYLFSMSMGQGVSIMIGWSVGQKNPEQAKGICLFASRCSFIIAMACTLVLCLVRKPLFNLIVDDRQIIALATSVLLTNFLREAGRSRNLVLVNALRAAGDVRFPLYVGLISMWLFNVGFSWLLGIHLGWGLHGIWIALGLDECCRAVAMHIRWKRGTWMQAMQLD